MSRGLGDVYKRQVWYCDIQIGDWSQALTCLRMEPGRIWPNLKNAPAATGISVTPVDRGPEKQGQAPLVSAIGAKPTDGSNVATDVVDGKPTSQTDSHSPAFINPTEQSSSCGDLPLPFDLPASAGTAEAKPIAISTTSADPSPPIEAAIKPTPATMLDHNIDIGRRFVEWLTQNIREERVEINTPRARLHVLPEGLAMITPGIFRDFSPEHWDRAQKRFQKLKLHAKTTRDTNIWTCQVAKDRKRSTVKVMLIPDSERILGVSIPAPNPAMTLINAT